MGGQEAKANRNSGTAKVCKQCKRHVDAVGQLSRKGLCAQCSLKNYITNQQRMRAISQMLRQTWAELERPEHVDTEGNNDSLLH